jgi:hypothetical protein
LEKEYGENASISATLEDKAQQTATLAGVLLAADLGFTKSDTFAPLTARYSKGIAEFFVLSTVLVLLISIAISLAVLWPRDRPYFPGSKLHEMGEEMAALPDGELDDAALARFLNNQSGLWQSILNDQQAINDIKARLLLLAQIALAYSFLLVGLLVILASEANNA